MYFAKLNKQFVMPEYTPTVTGGVWAAGRSTKNETFEYGDIKKYTFAIWDVKEQDELGEIVLKVIPERYRGDFVVQCSRAPNGIIPHIDPGRNTSINFYVTTSNCVTKFFKFKTPADQRAQWRKSRESLFLKDLEFVESFVAQPGDAYLLDVSTPHSVVATKTNSDRTMVCLSSTRTFSEVLEMLKETNSV